MKTPTFSSIFQIFFMVIRTLWLLLFYFLLREKDLCARTHTHTRKTHTDCLSTIRSSSLSKSIDFKQICFPSFRKSSESSSVNPCKFLIPSAIRCIVLSSFIAWLRMLTPLNNSTCLKNGVARDVLWSIYSVAINKRIMPAG